MWSERRSERHAPLLRRAVGAPVTARHDEAAIATGALDRRAGQGERAPQPLYGARALADWIRCGGTPDRAPLGYRMLLGWHAAWFELNWRAQLARSPRAALPDDPVFIVGLWRSGTTVLHELLCACGGWLTPQTWQCFNPSTCFLTAAPPRAAAVERPMDRGRIATHGPQEDEFASLLLGEPSVYRGLIDPRRLLACGRELWSGEGGALGRWQEFLRGLAARGAGRLLLKSPSHTFRLPLLQRLFPRARFVWIARHPGEVLASNLRMWRAMCARYALWACPDGLLERFLLEAFGACARVLEDCQAQMCPQRLLWVDFEALQAQPAQTLRQILRFAAREQAAEAIAGVDSALAAVPIYSGQRAPMPNDGPVPQLDRLMRAARAHFGKGGL